MRSGRFFLKIYRCCDSLIIKAEEFDPNQSTYLQPMLEQRYCLGHLLHGKEAELAILDGENLEFDDYHKKYKDFTYVQASYDKAIGHCYRSFFDSADWFWWSQLESELLNYWPLFQQKKY